MRPTRANCGAAIPVRPHQLKLDTDNLNCAFLGAGNGCEQAGDERLKVREPIGRCAQNNDCDRKGGKILLKGQVSINGDKYVKLFGSERKQLPILDR